MLVWFQTTAIKYLNKASHMTFSVASEYKIYVYVYTILSSIKCLKSNVHTLIHCATWEAQLKNTLLLENANHHLGLQPVVVVRSDQISRSVMSDSLQPHESQHARPPCPSPTPGIHSDSCPSSQ